MAIHYDTQLDRTFHALGDDSRRRMLAMLAREGDCTAGQLGKPFGFAQPTISKHIRVLEKAGLVARQIDGRHHIFRLVPDPLKEAEDWISRHRKFWSGTLDGLGDYLEGEGS